MGLHGRFNEETDLITQLGFVVLDDSIDNSWCFNDAEVKYFGGETEEVVTDAFMSQEIDDAEDEG